VRTGLYLTRPPPVVIRFTFGATLGYCANRATVIKVKYADMMVYIFHPPSEGKVFVG